MSQLEIQIRKSNLHAVAAALNETLGIPAATLETTLVRHIQATVAQAAATNALDDLAWSKPYRGVVALYFGPHQAKSTDEGLTMLDRSGVVVTRMDDIDAYRCVKVSGVGSQTPERTTAVIECGLYAKLE